MVNQLNTIVESKIKEVKEKELHTPMDILEQLAMQSAPVVSMVNSLQVKLKRKAHPPCNNRDYNWL